MGLNQYQTIMACPRLLLLVESVISPKISKSTPLPSAQDEEGWKGRGNVEKEEEKKEERTKKGRKKKEKRVTKKARFFLYIRSTHTGHTWKRLWKPVRSALHGKVPRLTF